MRAVWLTWTMVHLSGQGRRVIAGGLPGNQKANVGELMCLNLWKTIGLSSIQWEVEMDKEKTKQIKNKNETC